MHKNITTWQQEMAAAITDPAVLINVLELDQKWLPPAQKAADLFGLKVPWAYVRRMEKQNPNDVLLRQVLPLEKEFLQSPGFIKDPVGDMQAIKIPGLLQKYQARILLIMTGACAIHCRYCFRRHYAYSHYSIANHWQAIVDAIKKDQSIEEIILSGGDPLALSTEKLQRLLKDLQSITHIKRLRIHTRQPIVLPSRIDQSLLDWLVKVPWQVVMVVHANHAQELDQSVGLALKKLYNAGISLFNQSVLLKDINDSVMAQKLLQEKLFEYHVIPYYLHFLDPVAGASHFYITKQEALTIIQDLAKLLPGYLLPKLVQEVEGEAYKVAIKI